MTMVMNTLVCQDSFCHDKCYAKNNLYVCMEKHILTAIGSNILVSGHQGALGDVDECKTNTGKSYLQEYEPGF